MAGQKARSGERSGPGNKAIAATLLEWLAVRGRSAARDRAERALGLGQAGLAEAPAWLSEESVAAMFLAAEVDEALARSIGHRLVSPDVTGLRLYGLGLATPEKAYRRLQALLPRVEPDGRWLIEGIAGRSARIRFESPAGATSASQPLRRVQAGACAFRKGMLEAIPGLYGLLPAEVEESACRANGADACQYIVRWRTVSHAKTWIGAAVGSGVAAGLAASAIWLGDTSLPWAGPIGATGFVCLGAAILGLVVGRVLDLRAQLESVAGARRGHLALFDQVDEALAEKLDALARADASLEGEDRPGPLRRSPPGDVEDASLAVASSAEILAAAQQIHAAAGDLECYFDEAFEKEGGDATISEERGLVREIREWAARIAKAGAPGDEEGRASLDLVRLVRRAVATIRPSLPPATRIKIDAESDLRTIECEPVQIEHVVVQLLRNAVEASVELTSAPEVVVALRNVDRGVELTVEDRGVGIASSEIDEVFDPFFADRPAGSAGGMGLTVCLRIVERHRGELRIEAEARPGTRVTVFLPTTDESK